MKKNAILITMLALLVGFSSCSNEDNNVWNDDQPKDAVQLIAEDFDLDLLESFIGPATRSGSNTPNYQRVGLPIGVRDITINPATPRLSAGSHEITIKAEGDYKFAIPIRVFNYLNHSEILYVGMIPYDGVTGGEVKFTIPAAEWNNGQVMPLMIEYMNMFDSKWVYLHLYLQEGSLFTTDIPKIIPVEGGIWNVTCHNFENLTDTDLYVVLPFNEDGDQIHGGGPEATAIFNKYLDPISTMGVLPNDTGADRLVYVKWTLQGSGVWNPVETYLQAGQ